MHPAADSPVLRVLPVLLACLLAVGCPAGRPSPPAAGPEAGADPWREACARPRLERLERLRSAALAETAARGDEPARSALERWVPRGRDGAPAAQRVPAEDRAFVVDVVRRAVAACGRDDVVALTTELVRFQTVAAVAPPGQNPEFLALAERLERWATEAGLTFTVSGEHDAWELVLPGAAERRAVLFVTHADVAPVDDPPTIVAADAVPEGWSAPPYAAWVRDGNLHGRGTEDDKGPLAAAMLAQAALADAGLVPDGAVVVVAGTGEEDDWDGMKRYADAAPPADFVVSLDAEYPVATAEDGFVAWGLRAPLGDTHGSPAQAVPLAVEGGLFLTQIPDAAELWLRPGDEGAEALAERVRAAGAARIAEWSDRPGLAVAVETGERDGTPAVHVVAAGKSIHASEPEAGSNALWLLGGIAREVDLAAGGIATILAVIDRAFAGDDFGQKLGVAYSDPRMGRLVAAPTVLRVADGEVRLEVNMRRPAGKTVEEFQVLLDTAFERLRVEIDPGLQPLEDVWVGSPYEVDNESPLVRTLLEIYRETAGDPAAEPASMRGGTYARLFPGAVSFGPCLPGTPYHGHGGDEYLELSTLELTVRAVFEAAVRLGFAHP